jgi:pimeloyl-ACP methyl ester carboxylesterase
MKLRFLLLVFIFSTGLKAQKIDTVFTEKNGILETLIFTLVPEQLSKGLLVVLGGFSYPTQTLSETDLLTKACASGYTVVLPYLYRADSVDRNNIFETRLESLITETIKKYNIPKGRFIIGGHSWAGHQALLYAEKANNPAYKNIVKPNAVFGVDPPLDLKRLYNGSKRSISIDPAKKQNSEASMITNWFEKQFGGPPEKKPKAYEKASSFYRDAKDGGNLRFLKTIPIRLYADPDINWHIDERNWPVEWTNLADVTAAIVQLKLLGNKNAEFVNCLGKGYQDGKRHPHGFSMVDSDEFIRWADKVIEAK